MSQEPVPEALDGGSPPGGSERREGAGAGSAGASRSGWTDAEALAAWSRGAEAWRQFVWSGADHYRLHVHGPALLEASRPVESEEALDLGCGEGYFSRALARRGARVTGIELVPALVALARELEVREPLGVTYVEGSAGSLPEPFEAGAFDLVTACMALQDMSDPGACLRGVAAVLRPGGRMVFSVPHPCTDTAVRVWERDGRGEKVALKLAGYFETGPAECAWDMKRLAYAWTTPCWRLTLSEWSAMIAAAGFVIEGLDEPRPEPELVAAHPELRDCALMPFFLVFRLRLGTALP